MNIFSAKINTANYIIVVVMMRNSNGITSSIRQTYPKLGCSIPNKAFINKNAGP
jgi:hypothetical protein